MFMCRVSFLTNEMGVSSDMTATWGWLNAPPPQPLAVNTLFVAYV